MPQLSPTHWTRCLRVQWTISRIHKPSLISWTNRWLIKLQQNHLQMGSWVELILSQLVLSSQVSLLHRKLSNQHLELRTLTIHQKICLFKKCKRVLLRKPPSKLQFKRLLRSWDKMKKRKCIHLEVTLAIFSKMFQTSLLFLNQLQRFKQLKVAFLIWKNQMRPKINQT